MVLPETKKCLVPLMLDFGFRHAAPRTAVRCVLYSLIDPALVPERFADMRCDIESEEFSSYRERTSVHYHRISEGYRALSAALRVFMEDSQRSLEVTGV